MSAGQDDLFAFVERGRAAQASVDAVIAPAARREDPDTSQAAAARSPSGRARDRQAVLAALVDHPHGLTDFELAALVGRQQTSAGKRRGELRDAGFVEATALRRPAPSGSPAIVWRVTQQGILAHLRRP